MNNDVEIRRFRSWLQSEGLFSGAGLSAGRYDLFLKTWMARAALDEPKKAFSKDDLAEACYRTIEAHGNLDLLQLAKNVIEIYEGQTS